MRQPSWLPEPADPRSPSREIWDTLSADERARVLASLPAEVPLELHPPEGDAHRVPKENARDALDAYFRTTGRKVYVSSELGTFYPSEPVFCPDLLVVLDVETHPRSRWVVLDEGRGLDFVLEIYVAGDRAKDFERNVARYARLEIPEYFVFEQRASRLHGFRLAKCGQSYERIVPQAGRFRSNVLGLTLTVERGLVRFFHGTAALLFGEEVVDRLNGMLADVLEARDAETRRADQAEAEARGAAERQADLEARIRELEAALAGKREE